jgi:hypothetical protein
MPPIVGHVADESCCDDRIRVDLRAADDSATSRSVWVNVAAASPGPSSSALRPQGEEQMQGRPSRVWSWGSWNDLPFHRQSRNGNPGRRTERGGRAPDCLLLTDTTTSPTKGEQAPFHERPWRSPGDPEANGPFKGLWVDISPALSRGRCRVACVCGPASRRPGTQRRIRAG